MSDLPPDTRSVMGGILSLLVSAIFPGSPKKVCIVGLDNAGKTTILYALHLGTVVLTQPTIGSNVEEVKHNNVKFEARRHALRLLRVYAWGGSRGGAAWDAERVRPTHAPASAATQCWDIGGQQSLRQSWATYYRNTDAVVLVVDSQDRARMGIVKARTRGRTAASHGARPPG